MRRNQRELVGFILFWVAAGMLFMLLIPVTIVGVLLIIAFLILGYNLYCCKR